MFDFFIELRYYGALVQMTHFWNTVTISLLSLSRMTAIPVGRVDPCRSPGPGVNPGVDRYTQTCHFHFFQNMDKTRIIFSKPG